MNKQELLVEIASLEAQIAALPDGDETYHMKQALYCCRRGLEAIGNKETIAVYIFDTLLAKHAREIYGDDRAGASFVFNPEDGKSE